MTRLVILLLLLCTWPGISEAAITVSEVAWMGSVESPNHEWIELYNDGGSVDVNGWILTDGDSLNIALAGIVGAGAYVVLERTSDASAPGTAFLIYTGALKNTGTTLTLRPSDGGVEDQVSSGEDWGSLGGDNVTKATAQYTTSGWITAEPTPGRANVNESQVTESETVTVVSSNTNGSAKLAEPVSREPVKLTLPGSTLEVSVEAPTQSFVNQPIEFSIDTRGVGKTIENSLVVYWNFGDIHSATGKSKNHTYQYPGRYVVTVTAEYASQSTLATHEITILPVSLSLTKNSTGDIQVNNDSPYMIDVSKYRLRAEKEFEFPAHTQLLSMQTITVPTEKLGDTTNQMIALYDQADELLASLLPSVPLAEPVVATVATPFPSSAYIQNQAPKVRDEAISETVSTSASTTRAFEDSEVLINSQVDEPVKTNRDWPTLALVALLGVSSLAVLLKPLPKKDSLNNHE